MERTSISCIISSYATLVHTLPINEILNPLFDTGVLTSTAFYEIRTLPFSQSKTMALLDNFILRSLRAGVTTPFDKLVEVLIASDNPTAKILGKQLREGKKQIKVESPVEKYDAETAIRSMYAMLTDALPIDFLMPTLRAKNVVTSVEQQALEEKDTCPKKVDYLLTGIIIPSLRAKRVDKFNLFLEALKEPKDLMCQSLATELGAKLGEVKISHAKIIPPSDYSRLEGYFAGSLPKGISAYAAMEHWIYAICRIEIPVDKISKRRRLGTGFVGTLTIKGKNRGEPMVVLVTNNHVLHNLGQAQMACYRFGYQSDSKRWQPELISGEDLVNADGSFFFTHTPPDDDAFGTKSLDYTVVRVHEKVLKAAKFTSKLDGIKHSVYECAFDLDNYIRFAPEICDSGLVSIYHHPNGKVLHKSTQRSIQCGYLLCYLCNTEPGSSGSPLVKTTHDGHRCVIALHRGYVKLNGDIYNWGTLMGTIIDHIQGKYPSYFDSEDDMAKKINDAGIPI